MAFPTRCGHSERSLSFSLSDSSRNKTMANSLGYLSNCAHIIPNASENDTVVLSLPWYIYNKVSFTAGRKSKARTPLSHSPLMSRDCVTPKPGKECKPSPVAASCAPGMDNDDTATLSSISIIHRSKPASWAYTKETRQSCNIASNNLIYVIRKQH